MNGTCGTLIGKRLSLLPQDSSMRAVTFCTRRARDVAPQGDVWVWLGRCGHVRAPAGPRPQRNRSPEALSAAWNAPPPARRLGPVIPDHNGTQTTLVGIARQRVWVYGGVGEYERARVCIFLRVRACICTRARVLQSL